MLLQSDGEQIRLLPAIPADWTEGEVNGLCARGNIVVSQKWSGGKLTRVTLAPGSETRQKLVYGERSVTVDLVPGEELTLDKDLNPVNRPNKLPNIIYVLVDDMGYGDVSVLNPGGKIKTPNLDRLASEGMVFTDAHTTSAVCTPTRYGILTGRYNWRSSLKEGVLWGYSPALIDTKRETVASMLKETGYYTAFIGKWHLGWNWAEDEIGQVDFSKPLTYSPNDAGFGYSYGHVASLDMPPYVYVENRQPTAVPDSITPGMKKYAFYRKGLIAPDFDMLDVTPNFFRRAIDLVKVQAKKEQPFFLYLALPSPHTPILPTAKWQGKSGLNPYADFVMMIDHYLGDLLEAVRSTGIEGQTIIIFTADNGCSPAANIEVMVEKGHHPSYRFRGHKADIYEGGHRVPFIVKGPGIEAGSHA